MIALAATDPLNPKAPTENAAASPADAAAPAQELAWWNAPAIS
jgi:hypothetical protein